MENLPQIKTVNSKILCSINCFSSEGKTDMKIKWLSTHKLFEAKTNLGNRIVTPVTIDGDPNKTPFMMDAITGSLFNIKSGECLTSSRIQMLGYKSKPNLGKKLLSIKIPVLD
jgi:hypothetical protein